MRSPRRFNLWLVAGLLLPLTSGSVLKPAGIGSVGGVDLTLLGVGVLLLLTAVHLIRRPEYSIAPMVPFLVFLFFILIAAGRSDPFGEYQARKTRDFFLLTGVIVVCLPALTRSFRDLRGVIAAWALAGLTAAIVVLLVGGGSDLWGRSGVGQATHGPAYLCAAALVTAVAAWGERLVTWRISAPLAIVSGVSLLSIGSRGPLVGALVGLFCWALLVGVLRARSRSAVALAGLAIFLGVREAPDASIERIFIYNDAAREDLWGIARIAFLENPVLGVGWGNYSELAFATYPHNAFLEAAAELGVFGLLALAGVFVIGARRVWRNRQHPEVRIVGSIAAVAFMGQQFSSDLSSRVFWIAIIPTLLLDVCGRSHSTESSRISSAFETPGTKSPSRVGPIMEGSER